MADLAPVIETLENRWMRAWVARDLRTLKALTSRNFMMVVGSKPSMILDSASFLEAATTRYLCSSFRFGDIYVRRHGAMALFASQLEIHARIDGQDWSGQLWVADLWRKTAVRRRWRMVERVMSRTEEGQQVPPAVRSLQLWR